MEPRLNALLDLSSQDGIPFMTNASDVASSSTQRPPHQVDSTFVRPKALMLANWSPENVQTNDVRRETHERIYPTRAMPSAPIAQVLNNEGNLLSAQSVPSTFTPSSTTPFSGRLVDLLLESPEHTKQRWDQDQQFLQPENTGYSPSVIKLPRLPQPPKRTAKRPRIPPLLQGLHQPPPLPPEGRLFPPITGEKNAFAGERGYDTLFEESRSKEVDEHVFFENGSQELGKSAQHGEHTSTSQATAQNAPLSGTTANHEADAAASKEISTQGQSQVKRGKKRNRWSEQETKDLLVGVSRFGIGNWKKILQSPDFTFNNRTAVDLKDRFRVCCPGEGLKSRQPKAKEKEKKTADESSSHPTDTEKQDSDTLSPSTTVPPHSTAATDQSRPQSTRAIKTATTTLPILSDLGIHEPFSKTTRRPRRPFTATDDMNLLKGFEKYGPIWHSMRDDADLDFGTRHPTDLRDRFRIRYPEKYAKAGYKLKVKEKERGRERERMDKGGAGGGEEEGEDEGVVRSHQQGGPDGTISSSLHASASTSTQSKTTTSNSREESSTKETTTTTTTPSLYSTNFPTTTSAAPHPSYTTHTNTHTHTHGQPNKPFTSSSFSYSYLSDPLPSLPFSDEEDLGNDDMANVGDESPITLSRNILRWADANPSSLFAFAPAGGYGGRGSGGGGGSGSFSAGGVNGNEGVYGSGGGNGASVGVGNAVGSPSSSVQQQQQQQGQGQVDVGRRDGTLPEADAWLSAERVQSLASFKYRG